MIDDYSSIEYNSERTSVQIVQNTRHMEMFSVSRNEFDTISSVNKEYVGIRSAQTFSLGILLNIIISSLVSEWASLTFFAQALMIVGAISSLLACGALQYFAKVKKAEANRIKNTIEQESKPKESSTTSKSPL